MPTDNPFLSFLSDRPEAGYFSFQDLWRTPSQKAYFRNQFSNIQNQYLGQLGQTIRGGGQPTQTFLDFLQNFDWSRQFQGLPPQQRGMDISRYNPFTRWLTQ